MSFTVRGAILATFAVPLQIMRALRLLRGLITTKLGACAFCIRLSLLLSLSSWAVFAALSFLLPGSLGVKLALVPALGFTTLFASHLAAYAVRVFLAFRRTGPPVAGNETSASTPNRRAFFVLSARTIGLALVPATVASALWGSLANGNCLPPSTCDQTINPCCCDNAGNTKFPKCSPYYATCTMICVQRTGPGK
jgi:hypothetical protein